MKTSSMLLWAALILILCACEEKVNIQEQNKAIIRRANDELFNKGNLAFADEVFATDYRKRGPELIKEFVTAVRIAFPDIQVTVELIVAEGDMVAWQRTHKGTHQGEYVGIPATGKKITWRSMIFSRFVDGKIVEEWGVGNLREQLRK